MPGLSSGQKGLGSGSAGLNLGTKGLYSGAAGLQGGSGGGGGGGATSARWWQLYITANRVPDTILNLNEIQLMEGGINRAIGSTITVVGTTFGDKALMIDGVITDNGSVGFWEYSGAYPHTITFDLGVARAIDTVGIAPRNSWTNRVPKDFKIQRGSDGVGWTDARSIVNDNSTWTYNVVNNFATS